MTISDKQLARDKKYFFELSQSDEVNLDFAQIKFCKTMLDYLSEVERLQAGNKDLRDRLNSILKWVEVHDSFPGLNKLTGYDDLKAENAELRKANALYRSQLEEAGILQLKA